MNDFQGKQLIGSFIPGMLLASLFLLGFMVLREFLLTLTWAFIITYVTWPPYRWLKQHLNNNATLSAAIMTTIISALMLLAAYWLARYVKG